jgi:serine/threonine protein kinase
MSTNSDLASWGEPPATPAEQALGMLLDEVLVKIERGQPVGPELLLRERPELGETGEELLRTLSLVCECAASVREHDNFSQEGEGKDSMNATPVSERRTLPDPFPGEFAVRRLLGEGAFGKVWLADDLKLGRPVALKTLNPSATGKAARAVLAALEQEARHLAQLRHPNIVQVYAWREGGGEYYLALQYVPGASLSERLKKEGPLDWRLATRYVADVGEAVIEAHARGVIHRDIKPANILWDETRDEAVLTDFGVARHLAEDATAGGTPGYMPVEAFGGTATPAVDVYGLAATLFRLVTGELPFPGPSVPEFIGQIRRGLPERDPRCAGLPDELERIIRAGLAASAEARPPLPQFVAALRASLNRLLADDLPESAPRGQSMPVHVDLAVSRLSDAGQYEPVAATHPKPGGFTRDMKKVPRSPRQVHLRTGDAVRIDVLTDRAGYVTVFNIGPTGNLNLLYPDEPATGGSQQPVPAGRPLNILDVEMEPPTGRERLFALWSQAPLPLRPEQLQGLVEKVPGPTSRPYRATRDMKRIKQAVQQLRDWHAVVLELEHTA